MIAGLVCADLMAVCRELAAMGVCGDGLAWVNGCEAVGEQVLDDLVAAGGSAGIGVVLGTTSAAVADHLAGQVGVLVAREPADPALIGRFTDGDGAAGVNGAAPAGVNGAAPAGLAGAAPPPGEDAFALLARGPQERILPHCRHVPAHTGGRLE